MIIAQIDRSAGMMGCLDQGTDLIGSLRALCVDRNIHCGHISGYGYLLNPQFMGYSRSEKALSMPQIQEGLFVTSSLQGSISMGEDNQPDVTVFCEAAATGLGRSKTVSGRLYEATVHCLEFIITPVNGVVFRRIVDEATGLPTWLQMLPAGAHYATPPSPKTKSLDGVASILRGVRDEREDEDDVQLVDGDWLSHPRLGMCRVERFDGEERVKVRLSSGRMAELMLSLFKLSPGGVRDGARVFEVTMRARKM